MKTFFKILSLRLNFYKKSIVNNSYRRNQARTTIILLLAPVIFPILILASSYISELTIKGNVWKAIFIWFFLFGFFYFFTIKQRDSLLGGEMKKFIDIQPYSIHLKIMIDFILLIIIDLFFILTFFTSIIYTYSENSNTFDISFFYKAVYTITIALNIIIFQMFLLYNKSISFIFPILAIIPQIIVSIFGSHLLAIILDIFIIAYSITSIKKNIHTNIDFKIPKILTIKKSNSFNRNLIIINIRYLFRKDEINNRIFMFIFGLSPILITTLTPYFKWSISIEKNLIITFIVSQVFVVSSMEFSLQKLNYLAINYWKTYHISNTKIYIYQLLTTLIIGLISFTPLLTTLFIISNFYTTLYSLLLISLNIFLFSYINKNSENFHFVVKLLISTIIYILIWIIIKN